MKRKEKQIAPTAQMGFIRAFVATGHFFCHLSLQTHSRQGQVAAGKYPSENDSTAKPLSLSNFKN
jgi:hypothetical protein